jgi:hypothetical protein
MKLRVPALAAVVSRRVWILGPALLMLAAAVPARGEGRISFNQLAINDCREVGTCEWHLACQVGSAPETELVANSTARDRESVEIAKTAEVARFPVTVKCRLQEDDGWFGATWEDSGSATLEIPGGGEYTLALSRPDQGAGKVLLTVDSLEFGAALPASAAPAATSKAPAKAGAAARPGRTFLSVYQKQRVGHAVVIGLAWPEFKARVDQLAAKGSMLAMVDTWLDGNRRLWSGIFRSGPVKQELVADLEWEAFTKQREALVGSGLRLFSIAIYGDAKATKRYFAGVYHEGTADNPLWVGLDRTPFNNKMLELTGDGSRLADLELYRAAGGKNVYAGVFLPGTSSYGLRTALDWDAMVKKWKDAGGSGAQVIDLETYVEGGKRLYDAVLRGGENTEIEPAAAQAAFAAAWKDKLAHGSRLIDLDAIP